MKPPEWVHAKTQNQEVCLDYERTTNISHRPSHSLQSPVSGNNTLPKQSQTLCLCSGSTQVSQHQLCDEAADVGSCSDRNSDSSVPHMKTAARGSDIMLKIWSLALCVVYFWSDLTQTCFCHGCLCSELQAPPLPVWCHSGKNQKQHSCVSETQCDSPRLTYSSCSYHIIISDRV